MKKLILFLSGCLVFGSIRAQSTESKPVRNDVEILGLTGGVGIHTSFQYFTTIYVPANGLVVKTKNGIVLIDAAWTPEQAKYLLRKVRRETGQRVKYAIITHSHEDRIGGIAHLHKKGVRTYSTKQTAQLAQKEGYPLPKVTFDKDTVLTLGGVSFEVFYPGHAHAPDNIVVWLPASKVLFGGCMIKSATATELGNIADADLKSWQEVLKKVYDRFPNANYVVPGHGIHAGLNLIKHTSNLLSQQEKVNK